MTAMLLARAGHDVLLLERYSFPRAKPCGDCLSPGANAILQRHRIWQDVLRAAPAFLRGWRLTSPGGTSFSVAFEEITSDQAAERSLAMRREILDAVLLAHARRAGVRIVHHAHVHELTRDAAGAVTGVRARVAGEVVRSAARVVVGADGLRSVVARRLQAFARLPRLRKASFTLHTCLSGTHEFGEMRLQRGACLGIAPVEDRPGGIHNVTLVLPRQSLRPNGDARRMVQDWIARFGLDLHPNGDGLLTSGPFDWPVRAVTFDGAALVGDAAGYYDPFTGQGIYHALAGAELLAEHVDAALRQGTVTRTSLAGYEAAHRHRRRSSNRLQQIIEFVCARPAVADFAFARCARNPAAARELLRATGDLLPAESLFSTRFLMSLLV
jgi:flavin-dependent dehydrogenase